MLRRLMLISSSHCYGQEYLAHCASAIKSFLGPIQSVMFIPYGQRDWNAFTKTARKAFEKMDIQLRSVHEIEQHAHRRALAKAEAIFVGSGNAHLLLKLLYDYNMLTLISEMVKGGEAPYLGVGAGALVACPTIRTVAGWPVVDPPRMQALGLLPFQISPHFVEHLVEQDPHSVYMGGEWESNIADYHAQEVNGASVICLTGGSWITVENGQAQLGGTGGAKIFSKGTITPTDWGEDHPILI